MTWDELKQTCAACNNCSLCASRHHVVFGVGPENADILFVGEGPGEQEDLQGRTECLHQLSHGTDCIDQTKDHCVFRAYCGKAADQSGF